MASLLGGIPPCWDLVQNLPPGLAGDLFGPGSRWSESRLGAGHVPRAPNSSLFIVPGIHKAGLLHRGCSGHRAVRGDGRAGFGVPDIGVRRPRPLGLGNESRDPPAHGREEGGG